MPVALSAAWRAECLVDPGIDFLNPGTLAPTLRCAYTAMFDAYSHWMAAGPGASLEDRSARAYLNAMEEQDRCRRVLAGWLQVQAESVALLGNATDGINAALGSVSWQPGDRIVTSDEEHEALRHPLRQLRLRHGVEVDLVPFPQAADKAQGFAERISAALSLATRMVAVSQVSHRSGVRIDLDQVTAALAKRPDVLLLVDGSHAAGAVADLVRDGVDFYAFPGHKWLFGPVETGVLWVSERALRDTAPLMSGAPMMSAEGVRYEDGSGAWRYEYGTRDWTKMVGLSAAVRFRQQWPEEELLHHYAELGTSFRQGFEDADCGHPLEGAAPLFSVLTEQGATVGQTLWQRHRVIVKPQAGNIRISLPPWLERSRARELGHLLAQNLKA